LGGGKNTSKINNCYATRQRKRARGGKEGVGKVFEGGREGERKNGFSSDPPILKTRKGGGKKKVKHPNKEKGKKKKGGE